MLRALMIAALASPPAPLQTDGLSLRQAIAEALARSPVLGPSDDAAQVATLQERAAARAFDLQIAPIIRADARPSGDRAFEAGLEVAQQLPTGADVRFSAVGTRGSRFAAGGAEYTLGVSQPLLRGFGVSAAAPLLQARRDAVAARRSLDQSRQDLIVAVASAYMDVVQLRRHVAEAERSIDRASRLLKASSARVRVGLATELDVARAELFLAQSESALLAQREALGSAIDRCARLIGRPTDEPPAFASADLARPDLLLDAFVPPEEPAETLVQTALARRVELRESRDRIDDAKRAMSVARWNLWPDVTVSATYTKADGLPDAPGFLSSGWRFGVSTSHSFMRAGPALASATAAVGLRAAQRTASDAERLVIDEVRQAHRALTRATATVALSEKAVGLAERQVRLAQLRAERGLAGRFDIIDAEAALFDAQTSLIQAQASRALSALMLRRAAGLLDPAEYAR